MKWEYDVVVMPNPRERDFLRQRGLDGWELVTVIMALDIYSVLDRVSTYYYFKRPIP